MTELHQKIEDLSERFGLPHCPEYELSYFQTLRRPELRAALAAEDAAVARRVLKDSPSLRSGDNAMSRLRRGELRRACGDLAGALEDYQRAIDLKPDLAAAHAALGEAGLGRPEALVSLTRAVELDPECARAWLLRGAARLLTREPAAAKADLERCVGLWPDSALAFMLLGLAEEALKSRERAFKAYARAAEKDPVCSAACLLASRVAANFETERAWFDRAYDVSPVLGFITLQIHQTTAIDTPAYVRKIRRFCFEEPEQVGAYYKREATQSHFSHFPAEDYAFVKKLVERHPKLAWAQAFFGRAACYTPEGAPEGVRHLSRAIALFPQAGWFYAWRANAKRVVADYKGALADFAEAIRKQPYYHRSFVWRGGLLRKLGRLPEAQADLDRALAMDPHYSLTYYERSLARRGQGDAAGSAWDLDRAYVLDHRYHWAYKTGGPPSEADLRAGEAELTRALGKHASVPSLWVWRGQLKLQRNDLSGALLDFERACELDPQHALAHGWAGHALLESGRAETAVARLRRALSLEPRFWIARSWLAQSLWTLGDRKGAKKLLAETLKLKKTTPWARYQLGEFAKETGRLAHAERELKLALLLDGKYPEAYILLAQVLVARRKGAAALEAAQRCVDIAPNLGGAYLARAAAYHALGRDRESLADYRRVLSDFPYMLNAEQRTAVEGLLAAA